MKSKTILITAALLLLPFPAKGIAKLLKGKHAQTE